MLETLYYADEIRTADLPEEPEVLISQPELDMALSLVEMLEEPFDAKKYSDQYRVAMLDMIEAKRNGETLVAAPETPLPKTVDLMAALKASLEAAKKGKVAESAGWPAPQRRTGRDQELVESASLALAAATSLLSRHAPTPLDEYRAKRDFPRTDEPAASAVSRPRAAR